MTTPPKTQNPSKVPKAKTHTNVGVVMLEGPIDANGQGRNIEYFLSNTLLEAAFSNPQIDSVALYINSPGGSPTQSEMIAGRIRELSKKYNKPVHAFVGDYAASGGYWIACAADDIYAHKTSTIGSIGVVTEYYDDTEKLKKEGLKRHTFTAGKNKRPDINEPATKDKIQKRLSKLHDMFIGWVMERRGDKLTKGGKLDLQNLKNSDVFSADTWFGEESFKAGLIDGVGSMTSILEQKYGNDVQLMHIVLRSGPPMGGGFSMSSEPANSNDSEQAIKMAKLKKKQVKLAKKMAKLKM